jgi:hypothetical protein
MAVRKWWFSQRRRRRRSAENGIERIKAQHNGPNKTKREKLTSGVLEYHERPEQSDDPKLTRRSTPVYVDFQTNAIAGGRRRTNIMGQDPEG